MVTVYSKKAFNQSTLTIIQMAYIPSWRPACGYGEQSFAFS